MTQSPDERGAELRELFFETSQELLQALNDEALKLEKKPGDEEIVRVIRRTVHTLKGDSAACGLRELSELAHQFEDALSLEGTATQTAVAEIAFAAADVFTEMIAAYHRGKKLPSTRTLSKKIQELTAAPAAARTRRAKKSAGQDVREGYRSGDSALRQDGSALDRIRKAGHDSGSGRRPGCVSRGGEDRSALCHADCRTPAGAQRHRRHGSGPRRAARRQVSRRFQAGRDSCWPACRRRSRSRPSARFRPSPAEVTVELMLDAQPQSKSRKVTRTTSAQFRCKL